MDQSFVEVENQQDAFAHSLMLAVCGLILKLDLKLLPELEFDHDLSGQLDRALEEMSALKTDTVTSPALIRAELHDGNPIPLEIAMTEASGYSEQYALFNKVEAVSHDSEKQPMPFLSLSLSGNRNRGGDMRFRVTQPELMFVRDRVDLFDKWYCPHADQNYNAKWQMYP